GLNAPTISVSKSIAQPHDERICGHAIKSGVDISFNAEHPRAGQSRYLARQLPWSISYRLLFELRPNAVSSVISRVNRVGHPQALRRPQQDGGEVGKRLGDVELCLGRVIEHRFEPVNDSPLDLILTDPTHEIPSASRLNLSLTTQEVHTC